jgi:aryl-alcohol dehydrogenase-like predicted oxidoreductase
VREHVGEEQKGVTTVIPGARNAEQARANAAAGRLEALPKNLLKGVAEIYDERLREAVHDRW